MNGKRAKKLRFLAAMQTAGFGDAPEYYRHEMNRIIMVHKPMTIDGKTQLMLQPEKVAGTRHHNTPFMLKYKELKKDYYRRRANERGSC